ncbi:hypothetical protein ACIBI9_61695 [Nonomuraea sp. NPDC050451]|uniref:hypothetical protein n=1 Tax=Nonomuraea sp. NPDC050451 TaxID=3364364 RepID=UPI0037BC01B6
MSIHFSSTQLSCPVRDQPGLLGLEEVPRGRSPCWPRAGFSKWTASSGYAVLAEMLTDLLTVLRDQVANTPAPYLLSAILFPAEQPPPDAASR